VCLYAYFYIFIYSIIYIYMCMVVRTPAHVQPYSVSL